jgi:hypothetical protein
MKDTAMALTFVEGEAGFCFLDFLSPYHREQREIQAPMGASVWYVASPHQESKWCLAGFRVQHADSFLDATTLVRFADLELSRLLDSALEYPPALALARHAFESNYAQEPSQEEFSDDLKAELRQHLSSPNKQSFLAEACYSYSDFEEGCFYWIVGYSVQDRLVQVVGRDCWIQSVDLTLFGFTPEFLRWQFRTL